MLSTARGELNVWFVFAHNIKLNAFTPLSPTNLPCLYHSLLISGLHYRALRTCRKETFCKNIEYWICEWRWAGGCHGQVVKYNWRTRKDTHQQWADQLGPHELDLWGTMSSELWRIDSFLSALSIFAKMSHRSLTPFTLQLLKFKHGSMMGKLVHGICTEYFTTS